MEEVFELLKVFLVSLSPLEMKAGIPIAILKFEINPVTAYLVCSIANVFSYPLALSFLNTFHRKFLVNRKYKEFCVKFAKKSKANTGAYAGSVAAWMLNANKQQAFISIGSGVMISGLLVTFFTIMAQRGVFHVL